jgi:hypothetical protein
MRFIDVSPHSVLLQNCPRANSMKARSPFRCTISAVSRSNGRAQGFWHAVIHRSAPTDTPEDKLTPPTRCEPWREGGALRIADPFPFLDFTRLSSDSPGNG